MPRAWKGMVDNRRKEDGQRSRRIERLKSQPQEGRRLGSSTLRSRSECRGCRTHTQKGYSGMQLAQSITEQGLDTAMERHPSSVSLAWKRKDAGYALFRKEETEIQIR